MRQLRAIFLVCFVSAVVGAALTSFEGEIRAQDVNEGRELFQSRGCTACHTVGGGKLVGPDLQGLADRVPGPDWAAAFIKDPKSLDDDYATGIRAEYNDMMPPNPGMSDADVKKIVDFLFSGQTLDSKQVTIGQDDATIDLGRDYFTGVRRFRNGAPSCISCHNIEGAGVFGGGTLASGIGNNYTSLNLAHERNGGDAGVFAALSNPQYPVMKDAFKDRPLTEQEAAAVTAFLGHVAANTEGEERSTGMIVLFVFLSLLMAGLMIFGFDRIWSRRFRNVRKTLVGEEA